MRFPSFSYILYFLCSLQLVCSFKSAKLSTLSSRVCCNNQFLKRSALSPLSSVNNFFEIDKEADRKNRRTVYSSLDWKKHRLSSRYFMALFKMPQSLILRGISMQVLGVTLWSLAVVMYNLLVENGSIDSALGPKLGSWFPRLSFPSLPISLISPSLGLMLMFRTNAAYDRWIKGRTMWSTISTKSLDLMRGATMWISEPVLQTAAIRYTTAYSRCLKWYLSHAGDSKENDEELLRKELSNILSPFELDRLVLAPNKIQHILLKLSEIIVLAKLATPLHVHMEKLVCDLTEQVNNCEMIYTSPIPLIYTRHSLRFLLLWLLSVPMTLYHDIRPQKRLNVLLFVPAISFLVSVLLFGIEELGVQIEEPFSLLPLSLMCSKIQTSGINLLSEVGLQWFEPAPVPVPISMPDDALSTITVVSVSRV